MPLEPLHDPQKGTLRVAGLMSGSGTNLRKIIEREHELAREGKSPFTVAVIFSDNAKSNAVQIGKEYDIPVVVRDLAAYCRARGAKRADMDVRAQFDKETVRALSPFSCTAAAYAGYMSIATPVLVNAFLGVNVHPADLSLEAHGERKYRGAHAVADAIAAGERELRASTHLIEPVVDAGRLLMISPPVLVRAGEDANAHQERLKEKGDWVVFPKTLEHIARGRFLQDEKGVLHFDAKPVPKGLRMA